MTRSKRRLATPVIVTQSIEHQHIIHLSYENAVWFCQLLDQPFDNAALVAAFQKYQAEKDKHDGSYTFLLPEP